MDTALGLVIVSILALAVSLLSLWKSTLSPFKLKVSYDSPTFTLYKISPEMSGRKKTWWVPSIDMDFTFYNLGKRGGEVTDIRLEGKLRSKEAERRFVFYAKWIVSFKKFQQNRDERLKWVESSIERDWYPLILTGDEQKTFHVIFEGFRWDRKYTGNLDLSLQIFSSKKDEWMEYEKFEHSITENMYNATSPIRLSSKKLGKTRAGLLEQWDNVEER